MKDKIVTAIVVIIGFVPIYWLMAFIVSMPVVFALLDFSLTIEAFRLWVYSENQYVINIKIISLMSNKTKQLSIIPIMSISIK